MDREDFAKNIFVRRHSQKFLGPARATRRARWDTPRLLSSPRLRYKI